MMKKILVFCLIATIAAACEISPGDNGDRDLNLSWKSLELLETDNAFGLELFTEVAKEFEPGENYMISPLSVALALGMTCNGAASGTREAMEATLKLQGFTEEEINEGYKSIIDQLLDLDPKVIMEIANSIWYKDDFAVEDEFIQTNREYFYAEVNPLDFNDPGAPDTINQWVSDHTHELIEEIIDRIPAEAVMYLINAIYFKGTWTYEFDPEETEMRPFYPEQADPVEVSSMRQEAELKYHQNDLLQLVELPYGDEKFSMLVLLPCGENTCSDIQAVLDNDNLNTWTNQLAGTDVLVQLPKFKFRTSLLLNDPLCRMGMEIAFSWGADFTRINPAGNLYISRVIHKTYIDVDEEGTEAAAVTAVEISITSETEGPQPAYFIADKPFLFIIRENSTGSILFMGKLSCPAG